MPTYHQVTTLILAGGQSSRMGEDKGLMLLNGKPMISYLIETTTKICASVKIISNNSEYKKFDLPVYSDIYPGNGPLGGLHSGLKHVDTEYNLVLSCDVPFVHEGVLEYLIESSKGHDATIAVKDGKVHPLIAVYRKTVLPELKKCLVEKELKLQKFLDRLKKVRYLEMDDYDSNNFRNLNSKEDV